MGCICSKKVENKDVNDIYKPEEIQNHHLELKKKNRNKLILNESELDEKEISIQLDAQNEMKLYLDGKELETEGKVSFASKETPDTASISFAVGSEDDGSNFHFEGTLRNPKIWTRKLSMEEMKN
jgi:hypothetical protein